MEFLFIVVAFVAGGLTGYGLRAEVSREVTLLTADLKNEVNRLAAALKAKI